MVGGIFRFKGGVVEELHSVVEVRGARGRRFVFYSRRLRCAW
ncbi:hypothetical protein [Paracerasibacillus soli]|uniref:Uncharacterized protein n=1 Tax=Paracerasibacillus soli TaxID=480284 RepID=A0ABU5CU65_9BACI|nr:hypothetical protein [Virgibacillus soli]MDY0409379.1 hypothetical protein [Virgibacillus soli]